MYQAIHPDQIYSICPTGDTYASSTMHGDFTPQDSPCHGADSDVRHGIRTDTQYAGMGVVEDRSIRRIVHYTDSRRAAIARLREYRHGGKPVVVYHLIAVQHLTSVAEAQREIGLAQCPLIESAVHLVRHRVKAEGRPTVEIPPYGLSVKKLGVELSFIYVVTADDAICEPSGILLFPVKPVLD